MIKFGARLDVIANSETPIFRAIEFNALDNVKVLLKHSDLTHTNKSD